jgi:hypothetical protein
MVADSENTIQERRDLFENTNSDSHSQMFLAFVGVYPGKVTHAVSHHLRLPPLNALDLCVR